MSTSSNRSEFVHRNASSVEASEKPQRSDQPLKHVNDDEDEQKKPDHDRRNPDEKKQSGRDGETPYPI